MCVKFSPSTISYRLRYIHSMLNVQRVPLFILVVCILLPVMRNVLCMWWWYFFYSLFLFLLLPKTLGKPCRCSVHLECHGILLSTWIPKIWLFLKGNLYARVLQLNQNEQLCLLHLITWAYDVFAIHISHFAFWCLCVWRALNQCKTASMLK